MEHGEQHKNSGGPRRIPGTNWTYVNGTEGIGFAYENTMVELDDKTKKAIAETDVSPIYIYNIDSLLFGNNLLISRYGRIYLPDGIALSIPQGNMPKEIKGAIFAVLDSSNSRRNFMSIREMGNGKYQCGYLFGKWGNSTKIEVIDMGTKLMLLDKGKIISELILPDLARNDNPSSESVYFTDPRDGKRYRTVPIGNQTWLAENLCWEGAGVWYDGNKANGRIYGRLYTWEEALSTAPPGWHLPTDEEWRELIKHVGGSRKAAISLKSENWDGNDGFGFSALPGGYRVRDSNVFLSIGKASFYWSATRYRGIRANSVLMSSNVDKTSRQKLYKNNAFSIRLIRN